MAKESTYAIPKAPIFRETFESEQEVRLNGGVPTAVTFDKGIMTTSSTLGYCLYANRKIPSLLSVRLKVSNLSQNTGIFFSLVSAVSSLFILRGTNGSNVLDVSSGISYINGVATTTLANGQNEITITGISITNILNIVVGNNVSYNAGMSGVSFELVELYDYTLTANEVKNLYEGKRNRALELERIPFGSQYAITYGTTNSLFESNLKTWTTSSGGTFIIKYSTTNNAQTGSIFFQDSSSIRTWGVQVTSRYFNFFFGTGFSKVVTSTAQVALNFNGYIKVWARTVGSDMLVDFYQSLDGITYTQLGTTVTNVGGANSIYTGGGSTTLQVGCNGTAPGGNHFAGNVYRAWAYDANGTLYSSFDPTLYRGGDNWLAASGETWNIKSATLYQGRPEILNIDGRNGIIANRYSNSVYNLTNLVSGYNFADGSWVKNVGNEVVTSNSFTTISSGGVYKNLLTVGKRYRVTVKGTQTAVALFIVTNAFFNANYGSSSDLNINIVCDFTAVYAHLMLFRSYVGTAIITEFSVQEIVPDIINTAVTPTKQGSIFAMDFNGSTSKLDCGNYDSLIGDITLIAWVKCYISGGAVDMHLFNNGQIIVQLQANRLYFTRNNSTYSNVLGGIKDLVNTQIIITSTSTGITNIYLNTVLGAVNANCGTPVAGSRNLNIGYNGVSALYLKGRASGIRIIKGILTAQEIDQLFQNERKDYGV